MFSKGFFPRGIKSYCVVKIQSVLWCTLQGKLKEALDKFDTLLQSNPESPRALFGKALVTDSLAEKQRSNKLLESAIEMMNTALRLQDTPKKLRIDIGQKLAARQSFRGICDDFFFFFAHV